jgi:hypothetical protein
VACGNEDKKMQGLVGDISGKELLENLNRDEKSNSKINVK